MANYNCTQLGCVSVLTGTYSTLQSCQAACIGWGCPPQLTTNTDILFVYDNSGSYSVSTGMDLVFKATTAWTETLAQAGWVGTARHTTGSNTQYLNLTYFNDGGQLTNPMASKNETWLAWGAVPYFLNPGQSFVPSTTWGISSADLQQYWFKYNEIKPTLNSSDPTINTGMTIPTNDVLVVSFCHENSYYGKSSNGPEPNYWFKAHYALWDHVWQNRTTNFTPKGFLMPLLANQNYDGQELGNTVYQVALEGLMCIYNGNQNDVTNGGTGTIDGTWILTPSGSSIPNSFGTCDIPSITPPGSPNPTAGPLSYTNPLAGCLTVPGGLGTTNPCIYEPGNSSNGYADKVLCPGSVNKSTMYTKLTTSNPYWVAGQPTWGGLVDKGWGAKVDSMVSISQSTLSDTLNSFIGTVATPATICISAETDYNVNPDFSASSLEACNGTCFPLLDPWYCDGMGTPCYQSPLGTFTFGVGGIYTTSYDAMTACNAQCQIITAWTCSNYGCIGDNNNGQFNSIGECTTACQSYSCTTLGCYGPFQGTGNTGTYLEMSSCTATCYHFECVTSSYAASILPNIYDTGNTGTNGCVQLSGSVGTSPNILGFNEYSTLSACTGSCISWGCCEPLGITDNSVMYVYYDITSMDAIQTQNAIKGIIDWTEIHTEFTGEVHHILIWSERWLAYPSIAYTGKIRRFTDAGSNFSSYPSGTPGTITYDSGAYFATNSYGHPANYWYSTNSPANVLASVYNVTSGIDFWTSPGQYTGLATHTVYDSFAPGTNLGTYLAQATGYYTKGYDNLPISLPTDDVINVIFQDESYSMYHPNSASWGSYPVCAQYCAGYYKDDHSLYFTSYNSVTATTLNNNQGGSVRSFLYPTKGASSNGIMEGFALHSIAAISSGDQSTPDGSWQLTTYPLNNQNNNFLPPYTHAECLFDLLILTTSNPYWTGTVPTWGGLDQFGWFINFRFDTYSQTVFETDLTTFLSATTISCDTFCSSANTAPTLSFPYTSETECNPQCVDYNCGVSGCYTAATGEYSSLSACTASCYSYSCTTTGCADHNPPTGTTFPYYSTDGLGGGRLYYSYYGIGGTFSSNTDCQLVCNSWECGQDGCYLQGGGTGGTFNSQTHCQINCSGYNCDNQYGCIPEIGNDAQYSTLIDCQTGCTHYECNALLGCIQVTGPITGSIYEFQTQTECTQYCASFNCGVNGCYELSNLSGTFQDINQLPIISSAACTASCVSYNCGTSGCSEVTGTGGTYTTSTNCDTACISYSCGTISNPGCNLWNVPNYGTGGTWTTSTDCDNNCISYECGPESLGTSYNGHPTGCLPQTYTGGSYSSLTHCLEVGMDYLSPDYTNTGDCTTWNCTDNGCVVVSGVSGQFNSIDACTGHCTSYSCGTGTYERHGGGEKPFSWSGGGCSLYNVPLYGTGGTFFYEWECSGGCRSWDCTSTGCTEVSSGAGSGGTYLTAFACDSGCTSYNCTDTGCTSQIGSGGTYFNNINPDWGSTACTATCISYDCSPTISGQIVNGCLQYNLQGGGGSGGTFYNATASISALTACTAACISYECFTDGCTDIQGTGATGTFTSMSSCTGTCISWGCLNNPVETDSKIYAYYDTTSMNVTAVQSAIVGLENWIAGMQNFTGSLYHTCVNDERWLSWASSVYHSEFTAGTSTIFQNPIAMVIHNWASGLSMTNVYDNMVPGNSNFLFPGITTTGPAPAAANNDNVLVITFIDESGPSNNSSTNNVYTSDDSGSPNNAIPNFAGTLPNPLDQPTPTWIVDYTAFSVTHLTVTAGTGSLNCYMYPTSSFQPQSPDNELFALHVVASIDSGNQTPGTQGENWQSGTAPRRLISGGVLGGTPELCSIADLTALEISNPYLTNSPNVGKLDTKGWGYNINFGQYTTNGFNDDLSTFLSTINSNLSLCVSAETAPTSQYPHSTLSACTGECYSYECTYNGCVPFNGTGGTPTYYSTLDDCQSACTSWNCTTTACTVQTGTGGTFTSSEVCITACTSYNCEDITTYTTSQSWPLANGCIEQTGSGGTFYGAAAGSSGSSIFGFTACTEVCQSFNCLVSCTEGTTGCTSWPNTAATYTTLSSCTANCSINWYCTEAYIADTCDSKLDTNFVTLDYYYPAGAGPNNPLYPTQNHYTSQGIWWFGEDTTRHLDTFSNYRYTAVPGSVAISQIPTDTCESPNLPNNIYLPTSPSSINGDTWAPNSQGYYQTLNSVEIWSAMNFTGTDTNVGAVANVPGPYYRWSEVMAGLISLIPNPSGPGTGCPTQYGANVAWSTNSLFSDITITLQNCGLVLKEINEWCTCYEVPCDVFCDDGYVTIPSTAQGPFTSSGAAESACCVSITYSCVTATTIDSCSGRTTLPNQYNSTSDAWDWLTVNLPNTNLTTLRYESTTPAVNVSGACAGPNGGVLYEIAPVTYSLLNPNVSYNTWNLFINQMQAAGTTGILSGMSYSNVNNYVYAQSGQTIKVCDEICHCSVTPCECIELYDGTGQYTTYADCISGTTNLPGCCPDTGTTSATSWDCTSGITFLPICDTKPYIGQFNDQFAAVDYFRIGNPTGVFGHQRMVRNFATNNLGTNVPMTTYLWADVQANTNLAYQWQSCYKQFSSILSVTYYLPYEYVKSISHPGVTGGLEYTNWNAFYTAAAASFTLTTSLNALQVCESIDSQYWGSNIFGCVVDTGKCCSREDCFCYETYTTGGTFFTETQCLDPISGCCPTYTGWTCEQTPITNPPTFSLPCYFITQGSPITLVHFTDNASNGFDGETECNTTPECDPPVPGEFWSCVTTNINTCDPNGDSLGEITGTTLGPNMNQVDFTYGTLLGTNTQYPFSSSTDQFWTLLQPTSSSIGSYLGGYGQVETILTDYHYYDPYTPLSSTTFQLGSVNVVGTSIVHPNDGTAVYPLPYTLPEETCMGVNATGGTGMPIFSILSVAHRDINGNTPYGSWGQFIDAAALLGYSVTTVNTVADFGAMYPLTFGCSETTITIQGPAAWYSGCNWTFDMVPCLCDTTCCCESGFTQGYNTEPECLDPISGCCTTLSSYTCTINGCIDPGNGSGEYTGLTAFADCESVCKEWTCISSTTISDTCANKTILPSLGLLPDISEYSPSFSTGNRGPFDALAYFCDPGNGLQGAQFNLYKWDCGSGCGSSVDDCDAPFGAYKFINGVKLFHNGIDTNQNLQAVNNWVDLINYLNNNIQQGSSQYWNLGMDYNTVAQILWNGAAGTQGASGYELVPQVGSCLCNPGPCDCILTGGTGHSGTYHLITGQTQCEWDCCSGVTIPECAILITGQEEGVLYYDFDSNSTTKLFDTPPYERLDIAARQNKLWVYTEAGGAYDIKEYDVVYSPYFQYVFNRNISVNTASMGRGLTPTEDPNILLTANDKVYKVDITTNVATTTLQFPLPSGLTCTGDIMYDNVTGNMIITYGTGTTQYVGRFDSIGTLLEESHINSTTYLDLLEDESIDSLFNYGTWNTAGGYPYFNTPYDGPIYGITTKRRVIELLQNPILEFAPVEAQTLTLVNQITNKVHGATNIFNIVNGQMHGCVNISGYTSGDVYWCDGLLGCLPYPSNVTPPNSFGPYTTLGDCETYCNFVCGDCASSCDCELVQTPVSMGCDPKPTMADCIANNLANPNVIDGGEGCCDCFGCGSVTYNGWNYLTSQWVQYTVTSNVTFGNFATPWSSTGTYTSGDVVQQVSTNGDICCYTYVNQIVTNSGNDPHTEWTHYLDNYTNNIPQTTGKIFWIPCDEDCPTIITWSCVTRTTSVSGNSNSTDTCGTAVDTGAQGLSFTPQIQYIAYGGYNLWNTPFEDLKWDCGSQQNPLPTNPCPAPLGNWAKILGCRITHIAGTQATVAQGMIQTTWADFIDQINGLQGGSVYNFSYGDRWQDLEAILGSQSYDGSPVPGNSVDIECIWEYCVCNPNTPGCNLCMSNVWNYGTSTTPNYAPMVDISTMFYGGALGDGTSPYTFNDISQAVDIITNPANGLFNTNFTEMKWEKMPITGPGGQPYFQTANGCTQAALSGLGYPDCNPLLPDFGADNGNYRKFTKWDVGNGNFGGPWANWADLLNDVASYINVTPGIPNNMLVTSSDSYSELDTKIFWYLIEIGAPNTNQIWGTPTTLVCGCSGQTTTPSYDPCRCVPINGPGGYPTSAMCEEVCCSGETSWSCNTGTTIVWEDSQNCANRIIYLPNVFTNFNATSPNGVLGYLANQANGFQTTLLSDLKYVADGVNSYFTPFNTANLCYDVDEVMTPDGNAHWEYITSIQTGSQSMGNYIESTLSWADFILQCQSAPYNYPVNLSMTVTQVFAGVGANLGWSPLPCKCTGTACGCVEIPGTFGYPTQASCEVICCPLPTGSTLYDCTINGCIPSPNGTFTSLIHCEELCKEWICDEGDCIGSCDIGGNNTPRTELPSWFFGIPEDIIGYLASTSTAPVQSPLLPPVVGNMQQADITYYKFDCINCSSPVQTCPSPNGTWFAPSGMWIENTPNATPFTYSGPHETWQEVIQSMQNQGFSVSINTTYYEVKTMLLSHLRQVVIKGLPCYGKPSGCDCVVIVGTGHTDAWEYTTNNYQPCVDACCSGDTFDCRPGGCILNNNGFGSYTSMSACTADCKQYECIPGVNTVDSCSGQTLLNVDWTTAPQQTGFFDQRQLSYLASPLNGLQSTPVTNWKWFNQNGPVAGGNPAAHCTHTLISGGTTYEFDVSYFTKILTINNSFSQSNAVFTNANNYDSSINECSGPFGCEFSTWAQLITGCNIMGVTYMGSPVTLNSSFSDVRSAIMSNWLIAGSGIRLNSSLCICTGTACGCVETAGTGNTGNFYSELSACTIAANANPCCQPPENWWTCKPTRHDGFGSDALQGECVCVQGVIAGTPGSYPSLQECKDNPYNCCDSHYYDCINQNTPQAGCVGLTNGTVGPYQTAADCDQHCPKLGYNCKIEDDGPGGSGNVACVPCFGLCQYTHITAVGAPYYGDALQQCQDSCPAKDCWKCCMDKYGYITQLNPSLSPIQCKCPNGSLEVQCDGSGPCPYPVSCIPGMVYNWTLCKCVCEQNQSCIPGYHWSYVQCKCVPNVIGPVDFVGSQGQVLQSISEFKMLGGVRNIINDFLEGVNLLEYMTKKGFYLGRDECTHCDNGTEGICILGGCLYYPNYKKDGNQVVGWKTLLVDGSQSIAIGTTTSIGTTTPILTGATLEGYSCVDNPNNPPTYTECIEYGTAPYLAYFGNAAPQYTTLQDCYAAGCDFSGNTYYQCTIQTNTLVGENQQACVPVDGIGGVGLFTTLEDCLNSGCSGWMACDTTQVSKVNGIVLQDNSIYPIPMCCESYINTATTPLTVTDCENHCTNMNETWFPLYNVIGINTFYESPLGYLLRELNPYVRNGSCVVSVTKDSIGSGRVQRSEYNINY